MKHQVHSRRAVLRACGAAGLLLTTSLLAACGVGGAANVAPAPATSNVTSSAAPQAVASTAQSSVATVTQSSAAAKAPASGQTVIRTAHSWDAVFWKTQQAFDTNFMKEHPDIKIEADNVPWGQHVTKFSTELAGNAAPDVQYCQFADARHFIYEGAFINEQPYMNKNAEFSLDNFTQVSLPTYRYKGDIYIVPYDTGPLIIFYNVDMFNKFGVPLPKTDWTFDDMLAAAVKLTQGTGVNQTWGYEGSPGNFGGEANTNYTMPFGARFLDKDEVTFMADTSEAATALQWWADLRLKSKVNPTPADTKVVAGDPFAFNKTAMMYSGSWSVPWLHEQAKFQYDVAPFPAGPKKHVTAAEGSGYGITKDSKDRDAAWTYQSAYLGEQGVEFMWGETGRGSPARKAAWQSYFKSPLAPKSAKLIYDALLTYGDGADVIQSPNGAEISRVAGQSWDLVLLGQMGAKDALSRIGTELGPVLEKNKPYVGLFG